MSSDRGDFIGQGASYAYDTSNAAIRLTARGSRLDVQVDVRENWRATLQLPSPHRQLEPGSYASSRRHPFQPDGSGVMDWSGQGRGCNALDGSLTIHSVSYQAGILQAIDLSFEQRCEGAVPALRGRVRVDSSAMSSVAPLQNAMPAQPIVSLESDAGDYSGWPVLAGRGQPADAMHRRWRARSLSRGTRVVIVAEVGGQHPARHTVSR